MCQDVGQHGFHLSALASHQIANKNHLHQHHQLDSQPQKESVGWLGGKDCVRLEGRVLTSRVGIELANCTKSFVMVCRCGEGRGSGGDIAWEWEGECGARA